MLEYLTLGSLFLTGIYLLVTGLVEKRSKATLKWHCTRCNQDVDLRIFRCGCTTSPSPWVAVKK